MLNRVIFMEFQQLEKALDDGYAVALKDYEKVQAAQKENPEADVRINLVSEGQAANIASRLAGKSKFNSTIKVIGWG